MAHPNSYEAEPRNHLKYAKASDTRYSTLVSHYPCTFGVVLCSLGHNASIWNLRCGLLALQSPVCERKLAP